MELCVYHFFWLLVSWLAITRNQRLHKSYQLLLMKMLRHQVMLTWALLILLHPVGQPTQLWVRTPKLWSINIRPLQTMLERQMGVPCLRLYSIMLTRIWKQAELLDSILRSSGDRLLYWWRFILEVHTNMNFFSFPIDLAVTIPVLVLISLFKRGYYWGMPLSHSNIIWFNEISWRFN